MVVKQSLFCALAIFVMMAAAAPVQAQERDLPPGAQEAEDAKQWDKAVYLYKKELAAHPRRYDLWQRIADIEASRDQPARAEKAMAHVLKIRPHNVTFLLKYAQLAEWAGDNAGAEKSYRTVLQLRPKDDKSRLALATVLSWEGKTKESIGFLEPYIGRHPLKKEALLLLSQLYMWNGDFDKSAVMIERYKTQAGDDKDYKKVKMQLYANTNQYKATVKAADALLEVSPKDCDAFTDKATALGALRQPTPMLASLQGVHEYCPDKAADDVLDHRLMTPMRSFVRSDVTYSTDSDTIEIGTFTLDSRYKFTPESYLLLGTETGWLQASTTSGFATVQGQGRIEQSAFWAGWEKMVSSNLWLTGKLGYHDAGNGLETTPMAHGNAECRPTDALTLNFDINHDFYSVSPRAVSLGVKLTDNQVQGSWRVNASNTLDMKANYGFFSDDNSYWTVVLTPRHNVITGEKLNADLGVTGQETGFAKTLTDGYYDPTSFSQFLVNADVSYAYNRNNKIGFTASTGYNKDDTMSGYKRCDNFAVEGNFGLYEDWLLNTHAGHSDSIGLNSTQYRVDDYTANIARRF